MLNSLSQNIFLFFLKLNLKRKSIYNFKDLNFKQHDFINYKIVKQLAIKENFINDTKNIETHTFSFLFFFQKLGGKKSIDLSKKNIFLWFKKFKFYKKFPWSDDFSAKRLINIIYSYDFICSISDTKEIETLEYIINFHIKRFVFDINRKKDSGVTSYEVLALVLIGCIQQGFNKKILQIINSFVEKNIDDISMHKSYNILEHAKVLNNFNEIKNILLFYKIEIPKVLNQQILGMTSLLSRYRHHDYSLPLFNNCNNNHNTTIQKIIDKEQSLKSRSTSNLINGIAIYRDTKKTLFFDVVQPTKFNFSKELSAGSLALEISALGEKIITNCGGSESSGKNPAYLKYSAAHSTIIINNTNISEIKEREINKIFPKQVLFETTDENDKVILTGTHNGYLKNYKKICKRKLNIFKKKNIFKGEDTIISTKSNFNKTYFHIRFHLMPGISTTITENKKNIIIKTKKNYIWIFKSNSEILVEKSIYVENNMATETNQIVINGITSSIRNKITWSLEKI